MLQKGMRPGSCESERKSADIQSGNLFERQLFHIHTQRVVGESPQVDMGTEIVDVQMLGIELSGGLGYILSVESQAGATDNQRVDAEVEWGMAQCVLRCQRVDDELEIRL